MNTLPLFVYGTLRDADILGAVLGRALGEKHAVPATAPGYRAVHMPGRTYPGLVRRPGDAAPGLLIRRLSEADNAVLDAFEGEEYRRGRITVIGKGKAMSAAVYLPVAAIADDARAWTLEAWTSLHKSAVLAGETRAARELRERLVTQADED